MKSQTFLRAFCALLVSFNLATAQGLSQTTKPARQLWHCGMHPQVIQDHPGKCPICHMELTPMTMAATQESLPENAANSAGPAVQVDPVVVQNMGLRTAEARLGSLSRTIRAVGEIKLAEPAMHDITLRVGGYVEKLYANQDGMHVLAGQVLFDVYSPDLQVAQQELVAALKAKKAVAPGADKEIAVDSDRLIDSAKRRLHLLGIADEDIDAVVKSGKVVATLPVRSPADGHLEDKMIVEGSAVPAMTKVMRVVDHRTIWLEAQVYQDDMFAVKLGQDIVATVDGLPGKKWDGKIAFIYPHLDHMTRTINVRMSLANPDFALRPGMYATAEISVPIAKDAILVPREAVVDTGTRQFAFVAEAAGHFQPRLLKIGLVGDDDLIQVNQGLKVGEKVVTSGQFLLDVESRTTEAINKLIAPQAAVETEAPVELMKNAAPTTQPAKLNMLVVAHCPMKKADWIQNGKEIRNPYFGSEMLECGDVTRELPKLPNGSAIAEFVQKYLDVQEMLAADQFKAERIAALQEAARSLNGTNDQPLRDAVDALAKAKDIKEARTQFVAISTELVKRLGEEKP